MHHPPLSTIRRGGRSPRIAVCSWSLKPSGPDELIPLLRQTGLNAVQLALSPLVHERATWDGAVERLREAGIEIVSGMMAFRGEDYSTLESIARTGGVRPDETWENNLHHVEQVAELAARCGIGLVTFHAGFIPHDSGDPERVKLLDRLRRIAAVFAERDIALALETGQETAETLAAALDDLSCPNVGVNFDPGNMILYGMGEPVAALRRLAPHVRQLHIKDARSSAKGGEWGTEVPAGGGEVDWPGLFAIVRRINESRETPIDLVIEREAGGTRLGDVRRAAEMIGRLLSGAHDHPLNRGDTAK